MSRLRPLLSFAFLPLLVPAVVGQSSGEAFRTVPGNSVGFSALVPSIALADVDADGDLDVLLARSPLGSPSELDLYRNDGFGQLELASSIPLRFAPSRMECADVDGDGDLDVVSTGTSDLLLNDGAGRFVSRSGLPSVAFGAADYALADLDGDGSVDAVFAGHTSRNQVAFNDGRGTFSTRGVRVAFDEQITDSLDAGDIDGDGDVDLVFAGRNSFQPPLAANGEVKVHLNDGNGSFTVDELAVIGGPVNSSSADLIDVDADGDLDLVVGQYSGPVRLFVNSGAGVLEDRSAQLLPGDSFIQVSVVRGLDADGDGDVDLVLASRDSRGLELWLGDGSGAFVATAPERIPAVRGNPSALVVGDLDRDGDGDLLTVDTVRAIERVLRVWANQQLHVDARAFPSLGQPFRFEIGSRPLDAASFRIAVPLIASARALTPTPFGLLGLDPAGPILQLDPIYIAPGVGHAAVTVDTPSDRSFAGAPFSFQIVVVDPVRGTRLTNVLSVRVRG